MISIILTVYNQENLIRKVLEGIWTKSSDLVKEVIIVMDGCTDRSETIIRRFVRDQFSSSTSRLEVKFRYTPDVFETQANNEGLRHASENFCLIIQDDMVVREQDYDRRLIKPMQVWPEIFAVTARTSEDDVIIEGKLVHINQAGIEQGTPRNVVAIRDSCNRGPLLIRHSALKTLNYLDEIYAPQGLDDHDLCHRAYQKGWLSCSYWIDFQHEPWWGTTRKTSGEIIAKAWEKNAQILMARHHDALVDPKHDEDRILE